MYIFSGNLLIHTIILETTIDKYHATIVLCAKVD